MPAPPSAPRGGPLVGLTLASDGAWSGRFWMRTAPRTYTRQNCATVRVVGDRLSVTYMDELAPPPLANAEQMRTVSAWGEQAQRDLARLRVGQIGAGSVGGLVGDGLARTGFEDVMLMDFDFIENPQSRPPDLCDPARHRAAKGRCAGGASGARATADPFRVEKIVAAIYEEEGFRAALDCDVLFACVDRPWGRYILNLIAYAHLIPVIDGGISVRSNRHGKLAAADWKAHTATIGRPCLQCLGQYDPGLVQTEREGRLDDPTYIAGLPKGHPLKTRENVFAFSMSCASMQMLQMLALTLVASGPAQSGRAVVPFRWQHNGRTGLRRLPSGMPVPGPGGLR